ncbi:mid1-interacting protein 1A-like [Uloborus diversus]|uniref:mid1-interacting protein 1A-like n=1 Tax=Uloborus diversus TaxID=327109 RepID=UPI00240949A1|nr:mid1-interacting protein 1A-like [Uloborus diversus]
MLNYGDGPQSAGSTMANRRRATGNGDQRFTCSQQSVISAIDRFVRSVNNMDETVLVPSRLRDMEVQNRRKNCPPPPVGLQHQDLYSFYSMLKDVKNELLWGPSSVGATLFPVVSSLSGMSSPRRPPMSIMMTSGMPMGMTMGMTTTRQPSDDGLGSSTGCSSDQDTDSDFESIMTDRESMIMEQTSHLATAFRHHLHGLHAILHQLADSADYLSKRYQEEIESPMP